MKGKLKIDKWRKSRPR